MGLIERIRVTYRVTCGTNRVCGAKSTAEGRARFHGQRLTMKVFFRRVGTIIVAYFLVLLLVLVVAFLLRVVRSL